MFNCPRTKRVTVHACLHWDHKSAVCRQRPGVTTNCFLTEIRCSYMTAGIYINEARKHELGWIFIENIFITVWPHVAIDDERLTWSLRWRWMPVLVGCHRSSHWILHWWTPEPRSGRSARWQTHKKQTHSRWSDESRLISTHQIIDPRWMCCGTSSLILHEF